MIIPTYSENKKRTSIAASPLKNMINSNFTSDFRAIAALFVVSYHMNKFIKIGCKGTDFLRIEQIFLAICGKNFIFAFKLW